MTANAGDVFCIYNIRLKRYAACQVTRLEQEGKHMLAALLPLDWSGPQVPANYIFVGNRIPLSDESTSSYGGWDEGYLVYRQLLWQKIPKSRRRRLFHGIKEY